MFCIDSKAFILVFDGGRVDPYNIKERRGQFRGSLWVGLEGLRWLLEVFCKLRNPKQNLEGFFEFHRDGYRILEFSCLANHGGRFVEVMEYHSGNHRGSIRIPKGRRGVGWLVFEFQVRKFFLGEIMKSSADIGNQIRSFDDGVAAVGTVDSRNGRLPQIRHARRNRSTKSTQDVQPRDTLRDLRGQYSNSRILMAKNELRPTRSCHFIWKPISKTLRITLEHGSRRVVSWVGLETKVGLRDKNYPDGPELPLVEKTQPVEHLGPGESECQLKDTGGVGHNTK